MKTLELLKKKFNSQWMTFGSGNGLVPKRQPSITWAYVDQDVKTPPGIIILLCCLQNYVI